MDKEKKKELILKEPTEELLTEETVDKLLQKEISMKHYQGFEISGRIHLGTGLVNMRKVKQLQEAGIDVNILLADWHTWMNDKLGGNLERIREVAVKYFKEGLKASLKCVGGDPDSLNFVLGSELYSEKSDYWKTLVDISRNVTLNRVQRSLDIAGRESGGSVPFSRLVYPPMQVADIFTQGINLAHGGTDQRKAHVVAREVAKKLEFSPLKANGERYKPAAIHTHLLLGLNKPPEWPIPNEKSPKDVWTEAKMSKSQPDTCVFITDSEEKVKQKIMEGFCPQGNVEFNPILDWTRHIVFPNLEKLEVERPEKFGGDLAIRSQEELEKKFGSGDLHPEDLKKAVGEAVVEILEPAREHFSDKQDMLEEMKAASVTR